MNHFMITKLYYKNNLYRNYLIQLLAKFLNVMSKEQIKKIYHMIKNKYSDITILNYISKKIRREKSITMDSKKRAIRISNVIFDFLKNTYPNIISKMTSNIKYLDIGSNNGLITVELGKKMGLNENNIYGIDVDFFTEQKIVPIQGFIYKSYDGHHIPYTDNYFDLVTCLMVLHHIKHIDDFVKEIYRVMKKGGILLIKEHNAFSKHIEWIISLEHVFYDLIDHRAEPKKIYGKYEQFTLSKKNLFKLLEDHNFRPIRISNTDFIKRYHHHNPTMVYYALFIKQ